MLRNADLDRALRALDPATASSTGLTTRASADLARIIASELTRGPAPVRSTSPRRARRALVSVAVVGVTATVVFAAPGFTGGDTAFATWVPDGAPLTGADRAAAIDECRSAHQDGPGSDYSAQLRESDIAFAESRGAWTTVRLADGSGFSALCVTDDSKRIFNDWFGSVGTMTDYAPPGARDVVTTDLGVGGIDAGELSLAAGEVGGDVVGITYLDASGEEVSATVAEGQFVLWLPGDEFEDSATDGVEVHVSYADETSSVERLTLAS